MKLSKLSVSEYFYSLQGEGRTMGKPAVFLRLGGCNLLCGGKGTDLTGKLHDGAKWRCDTIEVWKKSNSMMIGDLIYEMDKKFGYIELIKKGVRTIITGGEPLMQQKNLTHFVDFIENDMKIGNAHYEVETNGTLIPNETLGSHLYQWNVSPKLSNSGMPFSKRIIPGVLDWFNDHPGATFKFVAKDKDDLTEIRTLIKTYKLSEQKIWVMPAASTLSELIRTNQLVAEFCIQYQYNFSTRLQVEIWDKTTGV